ncbi:hypothetical protein CBR_g40122 [Chara braunii]|uniref:Uncharacterized protein n=1 Tax=Chara braunii TaxID=69332 RepID=A0A388LTB9_CHABU|nr:hypothetical protein CBR_g40122 [Chara braunii]|eukprot:GBG85483.1 hypothetical protein CBR_g40122 [Chara braunii]
MVRIQRPRVKWIGRKGKGLEREKEKERVREKEAEKEREREKESQKEKEREREREIERARVMEKEMERERERERERLNEREKERWRVVATENGTKGTQKSSQDKDVAMAILEEWTVSLSVGGGGREGGDVRREERFKKPPLPSGLTLADPVETLERSDLNIQKILIPLICANSNKGVMVMATQLANGLLELPTADAEGALTELVILEKVKPLIPNFMQVRVIPTVRVGCYTAEDGNGTKARLYFVFLDAKMDNQTMNQLTTMDKDWFPLSTLDSPANESLNMIIIKQTMTATTIAQWLATTAYRDVIFKPEFSNLLRVPWFDQQNLKGGEGSRRRKQPDLNAPGIGRIEESSAIPGPYAA